MRNMVSVITVILVVCGSTALAADLAVSKAVDDPAPAPLDIIQFTITAANVGAEAVTSATVVDLLPANLHYLGHSGGSYDPTTGVWSIGALAAGSGTSLVIDARALIPLSVSLAITNPAPEDSEDFGHCLAGLGSDKLVVGAPWDIADAIRPGSAYLFGSDGGLLAAITNPTVAANDNFGWSVSAVGWSKFVVGARFDDTGANDAGCAYLFNANGSLLVTITNPAPTASDNFGYAVAGVGLYTVAVGAPNDGAGASNSGTVYLFDDDGVLLVTITNPTPAVNDNFGFSMAGLGSDKLLVGAHRDDTGANDAGCAYLFNANGSLLVTITNPVPTASDNFGYAVAGVGSDLVVVGVPFGDNGALNAGRAHLFDTNGTLMVTVLNPQPVANDNFGWSVAGVGSDKFIVGAYLDDAGAADAGRAYLFDINGVLLAVITNPSPTASDNFGYSVTAVGTNHVAVGARYDDTGANDAGSVYLFDLVSDDATVFNVASLVSCNPADSNSANDTGTVSVLITDNVDLQVEKTGTYSALLPMATNTYVITVTNAGPATATDVEVSDALPSDLYVVSATPDIGSYDASNHQWDVGLLLAGGSATLTLETRVLQPWAVSATLANPAPAESDLFGRSVAAVGADKIVVGASGDDAGAINAGSAYLFDINGVLLVTITNHGPAADDGFGESIAGLGTDKIIVGAPYFDMGAIINDGCVHLFDINGNPLATITNPASAESDQFGKSVAALGTDKIIVGAYADDAGANNAGSAYLFDANGHLLATLTNPAPAVDDVFGYSVAGLGSDKIIIGAPSDNAGATDAGSAYLFDTNGILLATITNPAPAGGDSFGFSVAGLGTDRIIVGAGLDDAGANNAGSAYLFDTNGILLATIPNPASAGGDQFGYSVAALGTDRIIVGALTDGAGATDAGSAYLFDTNGVLLATITNPAPAVGDLFGNSVAALGADKIIVGADQDDAGAYNAGSAYVFGVRQESLPITNTATATCGREDTNEANNSASAAATIFYTPSLDAAGLAVTKEIDDANPSATDVIRYTLNAVNVGTVPVDFSSVDDLLPDGLWYLGHTGGGTYNPTTGVWNTGALPVGAGHSLEIEARVLIPPGLACTITNPAPEVGDYFGQCVAGVGSDKIIVGAQYDGMGAPSAGSVHLFDTNGVLLVAIGNPTLAVSDWFGRSVAGLGADKIIVGANGDDAGAPDAGSAYLFEANGILLATITNPGPAASD